MKKPERWQLRVAESSKDDHLDELEVHVQPGIKEDDLGFTEEEFLANPCEPPDADFFEAAQRWLDLGDAELALTELTHLNPSLKNHPDVLLLGWDIRAALGHWSEAFSIGEGLMRVIPEDFRSVVNRSISLRYMPGGGLQIAYDDLSKENYGDWHNYYLLARYACQLGKLDEARQLLASVAGNSGVRAMALDEPDFSPIWKFVDKKQW